MLYRGIDLARFLALMAIVVWPAVPLFWIPVHGFPQIFRRLGRLTYIMPLVTWAPLGLLIYLNRDRLLASKSDLPAILNALGLILFAFGFLLHIWTGKLLGLFGLMGLPEISPRARGRLITEGPFSVVRHPTYLAHTALYAGIFLLSGYRTVLAAALLDFLIVNAAVIPLEEKELAMRFGREYEEYREKVPRYFPRLFF